LLYPHTLAFTPDGRGLHFRGNERQKNGQAGPPVHYLVDVVSRRDWPLPAWAADATVIRYSPAGAWLATADQDRTVRLRDARSGKELRRFDSRLADVWSLTWAADG